MFTNRILLSIVFFGLLWDSYSESHLILTQVESCVGALTTAAMEPFQRAASHS